MYLNTLMGHGGLEGREDTSLEVQHPSRLRCFTADALHATILEGEAQGRLGNSSSELWSVRRAIKIDVGQLQWEPNRINSFQWPSAESSFRILLVHFTDEDPFLNRFKQNANVP